MNWEQYMLMESLQNVIFKLVIAYIPDSARARLQSQRSRV